MARKVNPDFCIFGITGYKCKDCGFEFLTPVNRGNGGYPEEEWYECPRCGSYDYEEVDVDYPDEDDIEDE